MIHVFGSRCGVFYGVAAPAPYRRCAYIHPLSSNITMKRSGSSTMRAPSPTNTAFSGISSYRTDYYKPIRDKSSISSTPVDSYQVARTHFDELSKYLASYLAKGSVPLLSPFTSHLTFITPLRTSKLPFHSTAEAHEAYTPAVPGAIYGCL